MKKDSFARLKKICEIPGTSGHEFHIRKHILDQVKGSADHIEIDALGNIIAMKKGASSKKLMISAHMDEIGFIVHHIDEKGFIRFKPLGGFDPKTLCTQRVLLYDEKTSLTGVIGTKPIHIMKPEERKAVPDMDSFYIDTGLPPKEVKKRVCIGMPISRNMDCHIMGNHIVSKSLDNRACVHMLIESFNALKSPAFDTYAVFSVQEEVGIRGATTAAGHIKPDFGIALDVTLANDVPGIAEHDQGTKLGEGIGIKIMDGSSLSNRQFYQFMQKLAVKNKISSQMELMTAGGTDASGIQYRSGHGSITGGLALALRYMHSISESIHKDDLESGIKLLSLIIENMNQVKITHLP